MHQAARVGGGGVYEVGTRAMLYANCGSKSRYIIHHVDEVASGSASDEYKLQIRIIPTEPRNANRNALTSNRLGSHHRMNKQTVTLRNRCTKSTDNNRGNKSLPDVPLACNGGCTL